MHNGKAESPYSRVRSMRKLGRAPRVGGVPINFRTVKDVSKAMKDVALRHNVSEQEQKERLDICGSCEHYTGSRCELCGCFMNFKTRLRNSTCPINKWSLSSTRKASIDHSNHRE